MGLIREPGTAVVAGRNRRLCTLVFLLINGSPGGTANGIGVEGQGLEGPIREASVVGETEGRKRRDS